MKLKIINVSDILANFYQPRTKFDKEKIKELSESILSNGLINPITVTPDKKRKGKYMIVSGERRWQGHRTAKIKTIPCAVKEYKDENSFMIESLVENIQREDLTSMETAKFILKIKKSMPGIVSNRELAKKIGVHELTIGEHLNLVDDKTPKEVKKAVEQGKLAMRSASMIKQLPKEKQVAIAEESMKEETGIGRSKIEEKIKEHKIIAEYGEEKEENKKSYEGVTLNIFLNKEERQATIKACEKEKLQMEILVKKNHLDWLKKEKYL
ncbi:MAG TPA: ParB/RepB/Spo0J family partition protein [Candidatus Pacearchaeota archaeon]|nr:ParB/RepB/Spo0J family partition protein [Candidatus Pacearchaeota archaeon]